MAGSIPASATSERTLALDARALAARRGGLPRVLRSAGGGVGVAITCAFFAVALLADRIAPVDPFAPVASPLSPPSVAHLMGTDDLGRDLFSGVVHGARTSLVVALAVTGLASLLGVSVGAVSGWRGEIGRASCRERVFRTV